MLLEVQNVTWTTWRFCGKYEFIAIMLVKFQGTILSLLFLPRFAEHPSPSEFEERMTRWVWRWLAEQEEEWPASDDGQWVYYPRASIIISPRGQLHCKLPYNNDTYITHESSEGVSSITNVHAYKLITPVPAYILLYMGCQVCQKYLQMRYLYISLWYINTTMIYLNIHLIYIYGPDISDLDL